MYLSERSITEITNICPRKMEEENEVFHERIRKTFYYGKLPGTERPSLPVTGLLVDFYNDAAPRELGKLDNYFAASASRSACISPSSVMAGMVYVKRLKKRQPEYLTQVSSSELFLISMMMASKFLYDEGIDEEVFNDEWAASGDLDTEDVNQLELDFLAAIDWQLFVKPEEFTDMLHNIERRIAMQQGLNRGWFSYTDLMVISQDLKFMNCKNLVMELSKVFSASSLAYLAGILTMVGSTMMGTATTMTLMKAGSQVLPLCVKTLPLLTLYPELSLDVRSSGVLSEVNQSKFDIGNTSELEFVAHVQMKPKEQGQSRKENIEGMVTENEGRVEPASDPEHLTQSKSQHKEQNGLLNGFLPPFLALVTLKDTLLNFVNGARFSIEHEDWNQTYVDMADMGPATDDTEICSSGPCLVDSLPNCWNVSMDTDWTLPAISTDRNCFDKNRFCSNCMAKMENNFKTVLVSDTWQSSEIIHCCCRLDNTGNSWLKGSLQSSLADINLRFATRSFYPVFVTT